MAVGIPYSRGYWYRLLHGLVQATRYSMWPDQVVPVDEKWLITNL